MDTEELRRRAAEHSDLIRQLLTLRDPITMLHHEELLRTDGRDRTTPAVGRVVAVPRDRPGDPSHFALITKVTPTRATFSYLTDNAIRVAKKAHRNNGWPIHLDGWPQQMADYFHNDDAKRREYERTYIMQAVYRNITHAPWAAFAVIRNTVAINSKLIIIPENGAGND